MPDEQIDRAGHGPAGVENVEESFASRQDSAIEQQSVAESEPVIDGGTEGKKYEKLLSQVTTTSTHSDTEVDIEHLNALEGEIEKVEHLTKLAKTKGLAHAITVAGRLKDYYALDTFHDELIDNLYDELLKEGLITRE